MAFILSMLLTNGTSWQKENSRRRIPYDGYLQLENGVGMIRLLDTEVRAGIKAASWRRPEGYGYSCNRRSGSAFYCRNLRHLYSINIREYRFSVRKITNEFFGEKITVSGLITGQDLLKQLKDVELGEKLLLPCSMLRSETDDFSG